MLSSMTQGLLDRSAFGPAGFARGLRVSELIPVLFILCAMMEAVGSR
jgi:hypothetical protein